MLIRSTCTMTLDNTNTDPSDQNPGNQSIYLLTWLVYENHARLSQAGYVQAQHYMFGWLYLLSCLDCIKADARNIKFVK